MNTLRRAAFVVVFVSASLANAVTNTYSSISDFPVAAGDGLIPTGVGEHTTGSGTTLYQKQLAIEVDAGAVSLLNFGIKTSVQPNAGTLFTANAAFSRSVTGTVDGDGPASINLDYDMGSEMFTVYRTGITSGDCSSLTLKLYAENPGDAENPPSCDFGTLSSTASLTWSDDMGDCESDAQANCAQAFDARGQGSNRYDEPM